MDGYLLSDEKMKITNQIITVMINYLIPIRRKNIRRNT